MAEINLMELYPKSKRPVGDRGPAITEEVRAISRQFGRDYFDGDRRYGYGGYSYHPRFWQETVKLFHDHYGLADDASVLDIGCGKGFMLHDFKLLYPAITVAGIDISEYAIANAIETMKPFVQVGNAKELPFRDKSFDLVTAINTIHNLPLGECKQALREIERVSRGHSFIVVDAWSNDEEKARMQNWVITARTMMHVDDWKKLFDEVGYTGDYYWFIA
jgi:ubiquinone/menaquinone biosynthesis C-methylase UbiE